MTTQNKKKLSINQKKINIFLEGELFLMLLFTKNCQKGTTLNYRKIARLVNRRS